MDQEYMMYELVLERSMAVEIISPVLDGLWKRPENIKRIYLQVGPFYTRGFHSRTPVWRVVEGGTSHYQGKAANLQA